MSEERVFKIGDVVRFDGRDAYVAAINDEDAWLGGRYLVGFPNSSFLLRCKAGALEFVRAADKLVEPVKGPFEPLIFSSGCQ